MISHQHKCIFIHQRKCAGTSICLAFGQEWSLDNKDWHFMNGGVNSPDASTAPPSYFRFSIVRNPFDRFISGLRYCEGFRGDGSFKSLEDILSSLPQLPPGSNPYTSPLLDLQSFEWAHTTRPQHVILYRPDGSLGVDYVMRFESLQDDFDIVCGWLGIKSISLPVSNQSRRLRGYRSYFDNEPKARLLLEKHFKKDFELFNYSY